jgi:hypothetical protein
MTTEKTINDPHECTGAVAPRRSTHISSDVAQSDGEVWQEKLAVCEGVTPSGEPRLLIRSFYRNKRTGERFWDEPPSGAGSVVHATAEMRKKAEMQKEELQLTLEMIPPEDGSKEDFSSTTKEVNMKVGFLGRFRKKSKSKKEVEISKDLNLQRAIARSIADQVHGTHDELIVHYDGENDDKFESPANDFDEELALAKALSISESAVPVANNGSLTEEEMFQRALEQSQRYSQYSGATGVAALPTHLLEDSFASVTVASQPNYVGKRDPNESVASLPSETFDKFPSAPKGTKLDP